MVSVTERAQSELGPRKGGPNMPARESLASAKGVTERMQNIQPSKPSRMYDVMPAAKKAVR